MTTIVPTPGEVAINTALGAFLANVLDEEVEVVQGQDNRVPQPVKPNHAVFTATRRERLATNVRANADCAFTASISGATMTVTAVDLGTIVPGRDLFGPGVLAGTKVGIQASGPAGGAGTYAASLPQVLSSRKLAAGVETVMQETKIVIQIDVHGPRSADNAQVITTLMRDSYGTEFFDALGTGVSPLHADDPKQIPFINAEQQYEDRWVIEALLQADIVVSVPQQFADSVEVSVVSVDVTYPP